MDLCIAAGGMLRKWPASSSPGGAMKDVFKGVVLFCMWSLRRRGGQVVPVTAALLLLVYAAQSIGALQDVSSVLTQRQVAQSWRGPYDLLLRPPSAVSHPARAARWSHPHHALQLYAPSIAP